MRSIVRRCLVAVVPLCLVAACGSSGSSSKSSGASTAPASKSGDVASASDGAPDELVAAAKKEGEVTLYSSYSDTGIKAEAEAFKKKYGITVNFPPRESGNILIDRFRAEAQGGSPTADVIQNSNRLVFHDLAGQGLLVKLDKTAVPNLAKWPTDYQSADEVVTQVAPFVACFNTDHVHPEANNNFASTQDLFADQSLKIVMPDVSLTAYESTFDAIRQKYGIEFLQKLGARQPVFQSASPAAMQSLIAGEADIYFPCPLPLAAAAVAKKAPVNFKLVPPTSGTDFSLGITSKAAHPNAAKLFVNWMLTEDGASAMNGGGLGASPGFAKGISSTNVIPMPSADEGFVRSHPESVQDYKTILDALGYKG